MSEEGGRRAKRRCARSRYASTTIPSAIHYVGYVEDDETPEMIMAKFLELERVQQAGQDSRAAIAAAAAAEAAPGGGGGSDDASGAAAGGAAGGAAGTAGEAGASTSAAVAAAAAAAAGAQHRPELTDEQLLEVFRQTSMFNVKTALQDNEALMGIDELLEYTHDRYGGDEAVSDDDDLMRTFWSDEDEDLLGSEGEEEEEFGGRRRGRGTSGRRGGGGGGSRAGSGVCNANRLRRDAARARANVFTAYNPATQALVRRREKVGGSTGQEIVNVRVPAAPLPLSWGRAVRPYVPRDKLGERSVAVPVPPALLKAMQEKGQGDVEVMGRCDYREAASVLDADIKTLKDFQAILINPGWELEGRGDLAVQRLAQLPMRQLVPRGFVFVWVEKQHVQAVCRQMRRWGYAYIENLTWVYLAPNNGILTLPSEFVGNSHCTLYMFRREGDGKDIELRHQRNPDVTFDCLARADCMRKAIPDETFVAVETLLPSGKGRFLELWAPRGVRRPGWTHVVEVGRAEA